MKLFFNPASPFARKVVALLHELDRFDTVEIVTVISTPTDSASELAENPLRKIPTLIRSSGPAIYDSRTICRFLNDQAEGCMYPDGHALWDTLTLEATADGIMDAAVLMVYEIRCRDEATRSDGWTEAQWVKIERSLAAIESRWMNHLTGPVDMGHIAVGCALGYLDLRHEGRFWRRERASLAAWFAEFSNRPCMKNTVPFVPG